MIGRVINTTLQDTAPVSVGSNFDTIGGDSVVDELKMDQGCSGIRVMVSYLIVLRG